MKTPRILISTALALALVSCGPAREVAEFVGKATTSLTTTITNPLGPVDIYRVKNAYAASLQLAADYRSYCWSKSYAAIVADPISKVACENRRAIVRAMQRTSSNASGAIRVADKFIRDNPNGNAISYVSSAWDAVQSFRSSIPTVR